MSTESEKSDKKASKGSGDRVANPSLNMDELRELADLIEERGITEFEFENEVIRVRMSKNAPATPVAPVAAAAPVQAAPAAVATPTPETSAEDDNSVTDDDGLVKIPSPIVGTFYRAPGPDKDPFVKEGDKVSADSVVCIIEAMKLMNEIQAEVSGEIVKIYVENAQPVEYGQPLFGIKQ